MKKLIGIGIIGVAAIAVIASAQHTQPQQPPANSAKLYCIGTICSAGQDCDVPPEQGQCGTEFEYKCVPSNAALVGSVEIGTHLGNCNEPDNLTDYGYSNLCMPEGWAAEIICVTRPHFSDPNTNDSTHHGCPTTSNGNCSLAIRFYATAAQYKRWDTFYLGFDMNEARYHDVSWKATHGSASNSDWTKVVGRGRGPVHGPRS